jgi:hypothetical protein
MKTTKETYRLYKNKVILEFDSEKHVYTVGGKKVEGVTGVTGIIAKPALIYWAVNQTIGFLQKTLKAGVGYDEIELGQLLEQAKFAHRKRTTEAADIGTLVHKAIEDYIKTGKITPLVHPKAKECFAQFVKWAKDNKVEFLESERKVYSKKFQYAGTMDFYCKMKGKYFVGDTKTSSGIYDEMWFQVSAYQQAYQEETGAKVDGHLIVRVGKDGSIEVQENYDYDKNIVAFNGALLLYKRVQELNDIKARERAKGDEKNGN